MTSEDTSLASVVNFIKKPDGDFILTAPHYVPH